MRTVALVPAKDAAGSIGATVEALRAMAGVDRVFVVDDGSEDGTAAEACAAGAEVLRLPVNRGKGAAVLAGVAACPDAEVFLLIDADVGATAAVARPILEPVLADEADLVVGVLPAGSTGGLGSIRRLAAAGILRAGGVRVQAPLSGQRAVRADLLRDLPSVERFGLEVGMTIDAARAGARLLEVPVPMTHRRTGRTVAGFVHRGRQGLDIARSMWPRLTTARGRIRALLLTSLGLVGALVWTGGGEVSAGVPAERGVQRVVLVGVPHLDLSDVGTGAMPTLDRLSAQGAAAATNVRTGSPHPSSAEAYATLGAGARVQVDPLVAAQALPANGAYEGGRAADVLGRRTGRRPEGDIVVPAAASVPPDIGALGQALGDAGLTTAVVNNADSVTPDGRPVAYRPAAIAVADTAGGVATGTIRPDDLLVDDAAEPFGHRADPKRFVAATTDALQSAELVVVDLGDMNRVSWQAPNAAPEVTAAARQRALGRVDAYLAHLAPQLDGNTLLLVVGVRPRNATWELTPTVAYGAGVVRGSLYSPSTKREGLVTLTDVAPTILDALDVPRPAGMAGSAFRYRAEPYDQHGAERLNDLAASRERVYKPMALTFVVLQAVAYLVIMLLLAQGGAPRAGRALRVLVLSFAAWPLATFLERAVPGIEQLNGVLRQALVWVLATTIAVAASCARRHPLAPLSWIAGSTLLLLVVDVARGAELQMASVLGYSPHTAARYVGFGNTAFAVLAACAVVLVAAHVSYAPRRAEALVTAGGVLAVVLCAAVWPTLGADVGSALTLVPVFGLLMVTLAGGRVSWRKVVVLGGITLATLTLVAGVDLLRPEASRTHIGRFAADLLRGDGTFAATLERRWSTNLSQLGRTLWAWMVPLTAGFMLYVLVIARGWQRLLPARSALRAGVVATVTAGLLGWLANDSGVVVSALVFVFVGPYLTLLALDDAAPKPQLLS